MVHGDLPRPLISAAEFGRLDAAAEDLGVTRDAMLERALLAGLDEVEACGGPVYPSAHAANDNRPSPPNGRCRLPEG